MQHFVSLFYREGLAATSAPQEVTAQALQVASAAAAAGVGDVHGTDGSACTAERRLGSYLCRKGAYPSAGALGEST